VFVKIALPYVLIFFFALQPYDGVILTTGRDPFFKGKVIGGTSITKSTNKGTIQYPARDLNTKYKSKYFVSGNVMEFSPASKFTSPLQTALQFLQYYEIRSVHSVQNQIQIQYSNYSNNKEISLFVIEKFHSNLIDKNGNTPLIIALQQVFFYHFPLFIAQACFIRNHQIALKFWLASYRSGNILG
jgi:hypothetical protein